jgi:hypothetical protein
VCCSGIRTTDPGVSAIVLRDVAIRHRGLGARFRFDDARRGSWSRGSCYALRAGAATDPW